MKKSKNLRILILVLLIGFVGYIVFSVILILQSPSYRSVSLSKNPYASLFKQEIDFRFSNYSIFESDTVSQYVLNDTVRIMLVKNSKISLGEIVEIDSLRNKQIKPSDDVVFFDISFGGANLLISPTSGSKSKLKMFLNKPFTIKTNYTSCVHRLIANYPGEMQLLDDGKTILYYSPKHQGVIATLAFMRNNNNCYLVIVMQSIFDKHNYIDELMVCES